MLLHCMLWTSHFSSAYLFLYPNLDIWSLVGVIITRGWFLIDRPSSGSDSLRISKINAIILPHRGIRSASPLHIHPLPSPQQHSSSIPSLLASRQHFHCRFLAHNPYRVCLEASFPPARSRSSSSPLSSLLSHSSPLATLRSFSPFNPFRLPPIPSNPLFFLRSSHTASLLPRFHRIALLFGHANDSSGRCSDYVQPISLVWDVSPFLSLDRGFRGFRAY